jgi:SAM-dependent methyltransferase
MTGAFVATVQAGRDVSLGRVAPHPSTPFDLPYALLMQGRANSLGNIMTKSLTPAPNPASAPEYVHGYDAREHTRLQDQAQTLVELLHGDTAYPADVRVLEAGCGVGAQTITLAQKSPAAHFTSIDISADSVAVAKRRVAALGCSNVEFQVADIFAAPFAPASFDHVFVCFVLEHLRNPVAALRALQWLLKPNGTITVIEGDHGSTYFHPEDAAARDAIRCQVELQREAGGNALVGRELFPLLQQAGFAGVQVSPRMVYVDGSRPALIDGFTRKTFTAMIEGVRQQAVSRGLITPERFDAGVKALYRTAESNGVFCYTFFKATAFRP